MQSSSTIYTSPSFNCHPSNNIADIADRVIQELRAQNRFEDDDIISFSDDDNQPDTGDRDEDVVNVGPEVMNQTEEEVPDHEDEHEFEFPVICDDSDFNLCQISTELVSGDQISPRYPLFDRSLLSDEPIVPISPTPAPRSSLMKLFNEDRDTDSDLTSSSEADELDGITPGTYCVWTPKTVPRGKHKKSNSISVGNISNRWKVRDLLKRSYSDDSYSVGGNDSPVFLFIPPISPEKVNKSEKGVKLGSVKTERKIPAYKSKIGNIRLPAYLPYRQDQVAGAFANKNFHRY